MMHHELVDDGALEVCVPKVLQAILDEEGVTLIVPAGMSPLFVGGFLSSLGMVVVDGVCSTPKGAHEAQSRIRNQRIRNTRAAKARNEKN